MCVSCVRAIPTGVRASDDDGTSPCRGLRGSGERVNASSAPDCPDTGNTNRRGPGGSRAAQCARHCQIVRSRSWDCAADQPPFRGHSFRQSVFPGLAHTQRIQDRGSASTTAGLASNSPPACGPAGYLNGMRPGSELGRQVAVDFESDTDLLECGSCPIRSCLPAFHNDQQPKLGDV